MLKEVKGLGPKTIIELSRLNITNVNELLMHYPYRYNYFKPSKISDAIKNEEVVITGTIETLPKVFFIRRNLNRLTFNLNTDDLIIKVVIFNRGFLKNNLTINKEITLIGKYDQLKNTFTASDIKLSPIINPEIEPVYYLTNNIKKQNFNKIISSAIESNFKIDNYIPDYLMEKYNLMSKENSIQLIHKPRSFEDIKKAKITLIYEELFSYMLKLSYLKLKKQKEKIDNVKSYDIKEVKEFIQSLPFKLTDDQTKTLKEISSDFSSKKRMNRLILGDVGSGKTIVAFIALFINYLSGYQGVLMVPTEILANQHYDSFKKIFKNQKIKVAKLSSSISSKERKEILQNLKGNKIDVLISTHSVLNDEVSFYKLGLVITDEQHRFGVNQRKNLQEKGADVDVIYMSATPIPRTVALTLYGDMDISQIKTKPSNNKEVITKLLKESEIKVVLKEMLNELMKDHQIYVIVPLALENEDSDLENVESIYKKLDIAFNKKVPMQIIHGKLKNDEKQQAMKDFEDNKTKILISTTVIEVGIDIKNATMIVIFDAERFGLATLHQLRGRVGRSSLQSKCFLISNSETERLKVLTESNDGFYISEKDFELRGTGDLFGVKQSGDMDFKIANLKTDYKILLQAKEDSEEFLKKHLKRVGKFPNQQKLISSIEFID